jgi:uncharacterized protein YdeI (YjbR/CyaY-like superfamily)
MIRFTPRRPKSYWSAVNVRRATALVGKGRMSPAGRHAFAQRDKLRASKYSFENRPKRFDDVCERRLRADSRARAFFDAQPPYYRRVMVFWVMSAVKEDTRLRRLDTLIREARAGRRVDLGTSTKSKSPTLESS